MKKLVICMYSSDLCLVIKNDCIFITLSHYDIHKYLLHTLINECTFSLRKNLCIRTGICLEINRLFFLSVFRNTSSLTELQKPINLLIIVTKKKTNNL